MKLIFKGIAANFVITSLSDVCEGLLGPATASHLISNIALFAYTWSRLLVALWH